MLFICATIAEYCNLDELATTDPSIKEKISRITDVCAAKALRCHVDHQGKLYEHLFECFLDFTRMPIQQTSPSMCLGSLFRAYPTLILRPEAMEWMDGVFVSNDTTTQARLLTIIYDFLVSERDKKQAEPKGHGKKGSKGDMQALIGNAADLSESG